ncbi:MAG: murein transglycosylase A [Magnetococcales bacterium]|nr:murein transglycosylase A [Magnetococcales bacterium]
MNDFAGMRRHGPQLALLVLGFVAFALILWSRGHRPPAPVAVVPVLVEARWEEVLPELKRADGLQRWAEALAGSADYYKRLPASAVVRFGEVEVKASVMREACLRLAALAREKGPQEVAEVLRGEFRLWRSTGRAEKKDVLVTAYYEPLLKGDRKFSERFRHPVYRLPPDLLTADLGEWSEEWKGRKLVARVEGNRLKPFWDRDAIDYANRLSGRNLEIVWVEDPLALFFLHIQGSGRVELPDGSRIRLGYQGANGHPYRSIGAILIKEGKMSRGQMSMPGLKAWLGAHPEEVRRVLTANPSYVFFQEQEGGPFGNIGVALTAGHSIATDHQLFPKGAPGLLRTKLPVFGEKEVPESWREKLMWVVNQDTGGAIKGAGRVDLFMGFGEGAERAAGIMQQEGSALYFLSPK